MHPARRTSTVTIFSSRFQCKLCSKTGIEYKFLLRHLSRKHPTASAETQITALPKNSVIEKWVEKVLEVQGRLLQKTEEPQQTNKVELIDPLKRFKCTYCEYRTRYLSDVRKHERRHLLQKPLKCGYCDFEGVINSDITKHTRKKHKGMEVSIILNPMPSKPTIGAIGIRKRKSKLSAPIVSSTAPSMDDEDVVVTTVEDGEGSSDSTKKSEKVDSLLNTTKLDGNLKKYKCLVCEHTSDSYMYMRADHVRSHFKPFECAYCKKR